VSNFVATANTLRQTLATGFTALPIYWPNDDREPTLKDAPNGFVTSHIRLNDEQQISLGLEGERLHRDFGELSVFVYVPRGSRVGTAEQYAENIRALFKTTNIPEIVVTSRKIGAGESVEGPGAKSRAYCVPLYIEFWTDRTE
jgi:hypothetical protein